MKTKASAAKKLEKLAKAHLLRPDILQNIVWGKIHGWSQKRISAEYSYNPNTISKYSRVLEREFTDEDIAKLMLFCTVIRCGDIKKHLEGAADE